MTRLASAGTHFKGGVTGRAGQRGKVDCQRLCERAGRVAAVVGSEASVSL